MTLIKTILKSLIIASIGGLVVSFLGLCIAIWISPNRTIDEHVTMPIPQLFSGIMAGIFGFIIILIVAFMKINKRQLKK